MGWQKNHVPKTSRRVRRDNAKAHIIASAPEAIRGELLDELTGGSKRQQRRVAERVVRIAANQDTLNETTSAATEMHPDKPRWERIELIGSAATSEGLAVYPCLVDGERSDYEVAVGLQDGVVFIGSAEGFNETYQQFGAQEDPGPHPGYL